VSDTSKRVPNFGEAFNYTDKRVDELLIPGNASSIDSLSDLDTVNELRKKMDADGVRIDGDDRLLGLGSMSIVAKTASTKSGAPVEMPSAVSRIEYMQPEIHDIVLRPAYKKDYEEGVLTGDNYKHYIVPSAPDVPGTTITNEDILRTIQVLKADNKDSKLWDIQPSAFVFLKNEQGGLISYPDTAETPENFRGKPIAFIRDMNAMDATLTKSDRIKDWLKSKMDVDYDTLPPAPRECVEACHQQYAITSKLAAELQTNGIEPNVPIPGAPGVQTGARGTEVGTPSQEAHRA
jgi:hypothetical protein